MSDAKAPPPPIHPPPPTGGRGLGWFFAISGGIVLVLTLGCVLAVSVGEGDAEMFFVGLLFGSPTLILGGIFLWLGRRRLKR